MAIHVERKRGKGAREEGGDGSGSDGDGGGDDGKNCAGDFDAH